MNERYGVIAILSACVLNLGVGAGFYYAHKIDPEFTPLSGILVRVFVSVPFLAVPLYFKRQLPKLASLKSSAELWLWGVFGALTVLTYYAAIGKLGGGRTGLLNAGTGVFITVLAPFLAGQAKVVSHILGALGCVFGVILLSQASWSENLPSQGLFLALASGLFSALAYLMIARSGVKHSAESILLHWTLVNLAFTVILLFIVPVTWPSVWTSWIVLIIAGSCAAWSQYLTAFAYQRTRASLIACLSFCTPLFGIVLDLVAFGLPITNRTIAGMGVIALCGVVVPLSALSRPASQSS